MADAQVLPLIHPVFTRWRVGDVGPRGGPPGQYWRDHVIGDPDFERVEICVELVLGGDVVIRIASSEITTYAGTGQALEWGAALSQEPEIDWTYDFGAMSAESAARTWPISLASDIVDPASIIARKRPLAGIGEVSLQVDGMPWEQRLVLLRGVMPGGVSLSAVDGGTLSGSLSDPKELVNQTIGTWKVTEFSVAPFSVSGPWDNAVGQMYPIVLNEARVPCLGADTFTTTNPWFIVCVGHDVTVFPDYIWIDGATGNGGDLYVPVIDQKWDADGVPVTVVKLDVGVGIGTFDFSDLNATVHVDVAANSQADRTVLGMARHLLENYTCVGRSGLSAELWGLAQTKLGPTAIETLINGAADDGTEAQVLSFVESELLKSFPMIVMCWHGTGYGPVVTDRRHNMPRGELVAGQWPLKDEALSEFQELPFSSCFNNFTLQYDYDIVTDTYRKVKTRHKGNDALCQRSANSDIGERVADTITSVHIKDDVVADYVLDWLVAHFTFPSCYLEYPCYPWLLVDRMLGEEMRLTDPRYALTDTVVTIERLAWSRVAGAVIGLRSWHLYPTTPEPVAETPEALALFVQAVLALIPDAELLGIYLPPEGVAHGASVGMTGHPFVDVSGKGGPDFVAALSADANWVYDTTDLPAGGDLDAVVDMSNHLQTEYALMASALASGAGAGGILFKVTGLSGDVTILDLRGTPGVPHDASDGNYVGNVMTTDYTGFSPAAPGCNGVIANPVTDGGSGGGFWDGWGAYTGYVFLQWQRVNSGLSFSRSYLSKVGAAWAAMTGPGGGQNYYQSSQQGTFATCMQLGMGGSHGSYTVKVAGIYLATGDTTTAATAHSIFTTAGLGT